jgi:hypothetical protein
MASPSYSPCFDDPHNVWWTVSYEVLQYAIFSILVTSFSVGPSVFLSTLFWSTLVWEAKFHRIYFHHKRSRACVCVCRSAWICCVINFEQGDEFSPNFAREMTFILDTSYLLATWKLKRICGVRSFRVNSVHTDTVRIISPTSYLWDTCHVRMMTSACWSFSATDGRALEHVGHLLESCWCVGFLDSILLFVLSFIIAIYFLLSLFPSLCRISFFSLI